MPVWVAGAPGSQNNSGPEGGRGGGINGEEGGGGDGTPKVKFTEQRDASAFPGNSPCPPDSSSHPRKNSPVKTVETEAPRA